MNPENYVILDYKSGRLIALRSHQEVAVTLRILQQMYDIPNFDIIDTFSKRFLTKDFCLIDGLWQYEPPPMIAVEK